MKSMSQVLVGGVLFGAALLSAEVAAADYICDTRHMPALTGSYGNGGYIVLSVYTGANCGGSYVNTYYVCSTGASASSCTNNASFRYTETSLQTQAINLAAAARDDQPVVVGTNLCNSGGTGCFIYMLYR